MVTKLTWAPPQMAIGYQPACSTKPGLYPCYPIMPRFGLTGLRVNPVVPRYGISGLGAAGEGGGIFNTGILCWPPTFLGGDGSCTWGALDYGAVFIAAYALYSMFYQTKQTKYRFEAAGRRRATARAKKYRERAKRLESGGGRFFGFL